MSEDQLYDAAEREMDLYRAEITRITAKHVALRDGIRELLAGVAKSTDATRPSKKTQIEDEFAIALRKLLEDE